MGERASAYIDCSSKRIFLAENRAKSSSHFCVRHTIFCVRQQFLFRKTAGLDTEENELSPSLVVLPPFFRHLQVVVVFVELVPACWLFF